jgi:AraC family transcriptional regulator of adaptative response/methylated-DNA-[protein]-cysteine methyltransferase
MNEVSQANVYYQALLDKSSAYEGVFYAGVKTTAVFCRPTCTARKPKFENCEFFVAPRQALLAGYRPCRVCRPLSPPNGASLAVQKLVAAVEQHPERRWREADFTALSVGAATARRQFQKRFGMTFVEYARARRVGLAMERIRKGSSVIDTQIEAGFESGSGFRDAFSRIMGAAPIRKNQHLKLLYATWIDTPLGPIVAIADEAYLYLLEFVDRPGLEREIERLRLKTRSAIIPGTPKPIRVIRAELKRYFDGKLHEFETPVFMIGSPFQKQVWEVLRKIPRGETHSYTWLAREIDKPTAVRAVATANGMNQLALIIPCHRIIASDGSLGGYGGGLARKQWLIDHEAHSESADKLFKKAPRKRAAVNSQ